MNLGLFLALSAGLPLAGAALSGRQIALYLDFPPTTELRSPGEFSWVVFTLMALFVVATVLPFAWRARRALSGKFDTTRRAFPVWGWLGVLLLGITWPLAWTRFTWFAPWQAYTFTPLWLGYILFINAITFRRTGHCLLRDRPGCFIVLFPVSAAFWWYFEYLNRFVRNWHYAGVGDLTPFDYLLQASLPFATVLPAVLGTTEWLASFPRLQAALTGLRPLCRASSPAVPLAALTLACFGLLGIGAWPEMFYPGVWLAPLLALVGLQALRGEPQPFAGLAHGDWRGVWLPALAALVCGFFWEMWNWQSLAHWRYSVPYVHRFLIFEMPLLGYAGYLPFGVICAALVGMVCANSARPWLGQGLNANADERLRAAAARS